MTGRNNAGAVAPFKKYNIILPGSFSGGLSVSDIAIVNFKTP